MHFLPKANPLYEHIPAQKINMPDILTKLGNGGFTGYLSHSLPSFESCCIFAKGKLICVFSTEENRDKTGFEAISLFFDKIVNNGGEINIYRMTAELAMCVHALILGVPLFNGDEVRQVDIKAMLTRLKIQQFNGVVHFYTTERDAVIFYRNGQPVGFYHDGASAIESSPEESRKVAALPGARLKVLSTKPIEELMQYDLLHMVNVGKLWEAAVTRSSVPRDTGLKVAENVTKLENDSKRLSELVEDLADVAVAYLSRQGREVVEKRLAEAGGSTILYDSAKAEAFLGLVEQDAKAIDGQARIDEMIDLMKSEIAGRLAV